MSSQIFSILAWNFVPNLATTFLQSTYYALTTPAGSPRPQPSTPRFHRDRRLIYILVIAVYFLYSIYETDWEQQRTGNFYTDLQLPIDASTRDINARYRRLTVQFHPDKLGALRAEQRESANAFFVRLTEAKATLVEPVRRWAYERFGPVVLEWMGEKNGAKTRWEVLRTGVGGMVLYYVAALVGVGISGVLGYGAGLRWVFTTVALFVFELHAVTRSTYPALMTYALNPFLRLVGRKEYLPFQTIAAFRRLAVSAFLALNHLTPLFKRPDMTEDTPEEVQKVLGQLALVMREIDGDAQRMLNSQAAPFLMGDQVSENRLRERLTSWLVQNEVRNTSEVQKAIERVVRRKNGEVDGDGTATVASGIEI